MTAKLTTEQFIAKSIEIHGNKYSYELVEYKNSRTKVPITCPIHGIWEQEANSHIKGHGCLICGDEAKTAKAATEFATKASIIHNSKYDYSLVEYIHSQAKVKIVCKEHGSWEQRPNDHLGGKGCPICANEEKGWTRTKFKDKCEKNNNGFGILYVLECFNDDERFFKIGITSNSVKQRYHSKASMPYAYRVIDEIVGSPTYIYNLETKLHQINKPNQYIPSIPFGGSKYECFSKYKEIA